MSLELSDAFGENTVGNDARSAMLVLSRIGMLPCQPLPHMLVWLKKKIFYAICKYDVECLRKHIGNREDIRCGKPSICVCAMCGGLLLLFPHRMLLV